MKWRDAGTLVLLHETVVCARRIAELRTQGKDIQVRDLCAQTSQEMEYLEADWQRVKH